QSEMLRPFLVLLRHLYGPADAWLIAPIVSCARRILEEFPAAPPDLGLVDALKLVRQVIGARDGHVSGLEDLRAAIAGVPSVRRALLRAQAQFQDGGRQARPRPFLQNDLYGVEVDDFDWLLSEATIEPDPRARYRLILMAIEIALRSE